MDRNAKLAAARNKLAKFQKAKQSTTPAQRPESEAISRGVEPVSENGHQNSNGEASAPIPFSMNNFSGQKPSNGQNLSALEQVELHATREQLQEQHSRITELEVLLKKAEEQKESNATNAVQSIQQLQKVLEDTKSQNEVLQKTLTDEQSKLNQLSFVKDSEISSLKSGKLQAEQLSQQLNDQLNQLQHQVEIYQGQVSQNNSQNVANQHQLSGKLLEQQMTIEILVEEKAELNTRVRQLEELEISLRGNLESSLSSDKNNSENLQNLRQENKRLNESNQQLSNQIDEKDSKIKKFQQTSSRLKSEIDIIMLKDEDNKLMIEQLEAQIKKFQQINASLTEEKNMAEASLMQMSSGSDAVLLERNRLMDIVNELKARVQQQQYQLEEISSERDQYRVQQHATTEKSQAAINGLAEKLETSLMEKEMLQEEVSVLREQSVAKADDSEIDELAKTILEHEETFKELESQVKLQTEARHHAEQKVQEVHREKEELHTVVQREQDRSEAFQRRCTDLEQRQIEFKIMLESSEGDKATISRVLTQNKKFKDEFEELQNQLVSVTNQKADLIQRNDSLNHRFKAAEAALEESYGVQLDKDQWRNQLESHEQAIKNLRADLDLSQQEVKNTLRENAELREALKTARSQSRPVSAMVSVETMTDLSQTCTGEQGGYESSSYSFVGVSEQGSLADVDATDDVSEHAFAQTGVFPDDTLANIEPINSDKSEVILQMEAKITALEDDRNELTSQLVEAKQKQLKLMENTDAAMERPAQEDYSALKTAKEALETKFVDIIQQNASIKDENEKLEALVLQLNAETDTIIEYVSLYRDQRSALARKDKERKEELEALAIQRQEVQERVNQLEMLLKSTVQNIRPQVEAAQANRAIEKSRSDEIEANSDAVSISRDADADEKLESAPEPLELNEMEKGNIDKILSLLDEIRDPLQGQSTPAMIGMEYEGQLMIV